MTKLHHHPSFSSIHANMLMKYPFIVCNKAIKVSICLFTRCLSLQALFGVLSCTTTTTSSSSSSSSHVNPSRPRQINMASSTSWHPTRPRQHGPLAAPDSPWISARPSWLNYPLSPRPYPSRIYRYASSIYLSSKSTKKKKSHSISPANQSTLHHLPPHPRTTTVEKSPWSAATIPIPAAWPCPT